MAKNPEKGPVRIEFNSRPMCSARWYRILEDRKETVNQAALSKYVRANVMMTSQVIRTLEAKGLVQRERGISDPRAFSLSLTEKGRALAAEALKIVEQVDGRFFDCINKHKRNLVDVLNSLKVNENGI